MAGESAIQELFRGNGVFVTGATGFLGMGLVEKLLRCCPDVGSIYLLVRPKRGKAVEERLEEVIKNRVFDTLRGQRPDAFSKLVAVAGDVGVEELGLSSADKQRLVDNVSLVFHSAATLDFEASLKPAVQINLQGTKSVVELCKQLPKLKAMVHVSSAYVNSLHSETQEVLYPVDYEPDDVISQTMTADEKDLDELSIKLVGKHPNTYTFTKLLAEHVVSKAASSSLPIAIVRPSMITAAWKEPVPGWINSTNGPSGFLMGAAKGVVRRLPVGSHLIYDYIPVDVVINELIVAMWHVATTKPNEVLIYHCTSSTHRPFSWSLVEKDLIPLLHKYPLRGAVWYPSLKLLTSLSLFRFSSIFVHFIPAYFLDMVSRVSGARPMLVRLHTRVNSSLERLQFFIFNEWKFNNDRTRELAKTLSPVDRLHFEIDISALQWVPYFESMAQGVRMYMNKEEPTTLNAGRKKQTILKSLHFSLMGLLYALMYYLAYSVLGGDKILALLAIPITYLFFNTI